MANLTTRNGYDFYEVTSAMQKSIRRNKTDLAGFFALELFHSGYGGYVWKRLLTVSAEDCYPDTITTEIYNLYRSFILLNDGKSKFEKGRIFISKAVIILCRSAKSRDADHLQNLIYDQKNIKEEEVQEMINDALVESKEIPEYTFDVHTRRGKYMGKTKEQFFKEEFEALEPRQKGLFDNMV